MDYEKIFSDFLQHCQLVRPPKPWDRFEENCNSWRPPIDENVALAALQKDHGRKVLIQSGVLVENEDGKLDISPILVETSSSILSLRTTAQSNPFDLMTDIGTLRSGLPMFAAVRDYVVAQGLNERGSLFATFGMQDLLSLRAVGLVATMANGLEQFTAQTLQEFRSTFDLKKSGVTALPQQLIVVGWTPSQLSRRRPRVLDQVVRNLVTTSHSIGAGFVDVFLWQPAAEEIASIAKWLRMGARTDVTNAIISSLDQSAKPLTPPNQEKELTGGLIEAGEKLRKELLRKGGSSVKRKRRLQEFQKEVDDTLVRPILSLAAAESDPNKQSLFAGLAVVNQLIHPRAMAHLARLQRELSSNGLRSDWKSLEDPVLMKLIDNLYKLAKEAK